MKNLIPVVVLAGMFAFTACGPSAEEKARMEQATADSIAAADAAVLAAEAAASQAMADSLAAELEAAKAKAYEDSVAAAKAVKPRSTPKPAAPKAEPVVKPGQGRG